MTDHPPLRRNSGEPSFDSAADEQRHRRERLTLAYRLFGALGWGQLGDGHITARDPERTDCYWLLRYGVPFGQATIDDLVLVGPNGEVIDGDGEINPTAHHIHWPIHEARPDIVSATHTHTPYGTPWSACVEAFSMICQEAVCFHGRQALFDDGEVDIGDTDGGKRIAASLGEGRLVILRNHGLLSVGASVDEAMGWFLLAERVAEVHCKAPAPRAISDADATRAGRYVATPDHAWMTFNWAIRAHL